MAPPLADSLQNFRHDLEAFFKAQKRHNATRQRLQDLYVRLLSQPRPVGIAGIGQSGDSPESKGSRARRQAISLQELGGESSIRELLAEHLAPLRGSTAAELKGNIQDVWVDELHESSARVSLLFRKPVECLQLALELKAHSWQVARQEKPAVKVPQAAVRDLWSPVAKEIESGRLLEDFSRGLEAPQTPSKPMAKAVARKLAGKSPLFRPKDASALFAEIDAHGHGEVGKEELLPYLRDYLGYGHQEVMNFIQEHGRKGLVDLQAFKKGLDRLNPYAVHDRSNLLLCRKPGAFGGLSSVDFHLEDCSSCSCLLCDRSEEVKVDALVSGRMLIGPCRSSSFIRNCQNCTFWVATKQFRVRDCTNCTFYLHCHTEPVIESSKDLRIAPFCAKYPGLQQQFKEAGFNPAMNFWNAVYDFTGNAKHANWKICNLDECEELVVTFEGSSELPESPCPPITQEMLLAAPLESGESHGQSMTNVPQTRPSLPTAPSLKRLRRCISDASQEVSGILEAIILTPREPEVKTSEVSNDEVDLLEETLRMARDSAPAGARGRPLGGLRVERKVLNDSSDDDDLLFAVRGKAKAAARPKQALTGLDSDEDEPSLGALSKRQRSLLQESLLGLGARETGKTESSEDEIIIEDVKAIATGGGASTSESDDDFTRWKSGRPAHSS